MIVCTQKSWFAIGASDSIIMWCIEQDVFSPDVDFVACEVNVERKSPKRILRTTLKFLPPNCAGATSVMPPSRHLRLIARAGCRAVSR
jgi:hypothetical protein